MSQPRFLLVTIQPRTVTAEMVFDSLRELWQLVESLGGQVADVVVQKREIHAKGLYVGSGKLKEMTQKLQQGHIDVVVLNDIVKAGQLYEMKTELIKAKETIEVWDRVDLILQIFSQHAHTAEAKLQIELASMRHMGPRIYGMGVDMSRQGGGIGTRGIGETNTERMKRHWSLQMKKVEERLVKLSSERERQLDRRRKVGLQTVSLIGYTNAGKTSLYNSLVGKQKFTQNILFATLDASVGSLYIPELSKSVLFSDTIGFIQGLPPELVEAFRSTLMESIYADLILVIIDVSDKRYDQHIQTVEVILKQLGLSDRKRKYIFNKIDAFETVDTQVIIQKYSAFDPQFVSVRTGEGIKELISIVGDSLSSPG